MAAGSADPQPGAAFEAELGVPAAGRAHASQLQPASGPAINQAGLAPDAQECGVN